MDVQEKNPPPSTRAQTTTSGDGRCRAPQGRGRLALFLTTHLPLHERLPSSPPLTCSTHLHMDPCLRVCFQKTQCGILRNMRVPASFPGGMASYVYNWGEEFVRKAAHQGLPVNGTLSPQSPEPLGSGSSRHPSVNPRIWEESWQLSTPTPNCVAFRF